MELLIDILLLWSLISVCIIPILFVVQIIMNVRWYKKLYAAIACKQEAKDTGIMCQQ